MKTRSGQPLSLLALAVMLFSGCPGNVGGFDGRVPPDGGTSSGPTFTAADIGTPCTYDWNAPGNPTNSCAQGLSCLIYTRDGAYIPFPPGGQQNFTLGVWEDHFTRYRSDEVDEGVCTLIGTWQAPPACPVGTERKLLATNLVVCVKQCQTTADCGRPGYVCDVRYLDGLTDGRYCVRACELDVPDCVRSGHLSFRDQNGQPTAPAFVLAADDLAGASLCNVQTGICEGNTQPGAQGPGEPCASTRDCIGGTVCIQGAVLRSLDDTLPAATPGFCAQPCKPDPAQPVGAGGCNAGYACQAGFTFGHGDPYAQNQANGFNLVSLQDNGALLQAGGFCFPDCQVNGDCNAYPGTQCGAADGNLFGAAWNNRSMCLIDPLRR